LILKKDDYKATFWLLSRGTPLKKQNIATYASSAPKKTNAPNQNIAVRAAQNSLGEKLPSA